MKQYDFKTNENYTFFDLCVENTFIIRVEHLVGDKLQCTEGYISGYHPEIEMFTVKGEDSHDRTIPIRNVECITFIDKL